MKKLLGGMMVEAKGMAPPNSPWFGKPAFDVRYNPAEAKNLMQAAGYSKEKPLNLKAIISTSGSGQMQPLAMNEFIQQNLADVGPRAMTGQVKGLAQAQNWFQNFSSVTLAQWGGSQQAGTAFTCGVRHRRYTGRQAAFPRMTSCSRRVCEGDGRQRPPWATKRRRASMTLVARFSGAESASSTSAN